MKELDFDELDRAVSSLMGSVPKAAPVAPEDGMKTLTITSTLGTNDNVPATSQPQALPVVPTSPAPAQQSSQADSAPSRNEQATERGSLATRRSGRFMDVVHASSDMSRPTPSRPVSRQGVTLEPTSVAPVEQTEPIATSTETPLNETQPIEDGPIGAHDWPDPLDLPATQSSSEVPQSEVSIDEPTVAETETLIDPEVPADVPADTQPEPLSSPFLTDAKVEKRPLGGGMLDAAASDDKQAVETPSGEQASTTHIDTDTAPILPEELQDKLVAIEAGAHMTEEAPAPEEAPKQAAAPVVPTPAPEVIAPTGPTSIPQQYREEPTTSDQTNGAIYDTADYHQPLDHPAKKKSGWMWIVWVLVLLVLGGAGGAAAYLYLLN
jgi:hypothetical protein